MNEAMKNSSKRSFLKHSSRLTGVAMMSNAPAVLGAQSRMRASVWIHRSGKSRFPVIKFVSKDGGRPDRRFFGCV